MDITTASPVFIPLLPEDGLQLCDGHSSGAVPAIFSVLLPSGRGLTVCGGCARKMGFNPVPLRVLR